MGQRRRQALRVTLTSVIAFCLLAVPRKLTSRPDARTLAGGWGGGWGGT